MQYLNCRRNSRDASPHRKRPGCFLSFACLAYNLDVKMAEKICFWSSLILTVNILFFFRPEILSFQFWIQLRKRPSHAIFYSLSADLSTVIYKIPNAFVVKRPKKLTYIKDEVWWQCSESLSEFYDF